MSPFDRLTRWDLALLSPYLCSFHIFPVPANPISFRPCHGICILSCGCVGVCVRRYCCGFRSMSLKIGYRTLNCILHFWSLILVSIFFAWGLLKIFSKSFLLQLFCLLIPIWNSLVSVVILYRFFLFVCRNGITDFAKTGQVSDDTINLINY